MKPHLIGIAGPSSSGKTELANRLVRMLPGCGLVSLDSYYRGMENIPLEQRKLVNFDHPDALDWRLLHEHLQEIAAGRGFAEPEYSFADYARTGVTRWISPGEFLIVEGLFVLLWPELRDVLDTKVYVETAPGVCFARRLRRDVEERGRTPESVRLQYETTVLPGAQRFVVPTRAFAGMVVSGEQSVDASANAVLNALRNAAAAAASR